MSRISNDRGPWTWNGSGSGGAPRRDAAEQPRDDASGSAAGSAKPRESGERIATSARPGRMGKPNMEQRWTLDTFEGHAFIGARIWEQGTDGVFYPTQRGITIRPKELDGVLVALLRARARLGLPPATVKDLLAAHRGSDGGR